MNKMIPWGRHFILLRKNEVWVFFLGSCDVM